jgi:quercetin dioxygenase-like cupin family protein
MKQVIYMLTVIMISGCVNDSAKYKTTAPNATNEISRKIIERMQIEGSDEELRLMLIEYPPNVASVPHVHPVGGLCYLVEGTAESQYEGEDLKKIRAGDSFQDIASKKHLLFRNSSKTEALKFTCVAKIKKDQPYMAPL